MTGPAIANRLGPWALGWRSGRGDRRLGAPASRLSLGEQLNPWVRQYTAGYRQGYHYARELPRLDPIAPAYPWSCTGYVVDPATYRRIHERIAAYWVGAFVGPVPPDAIAFVSL